MLHKDSSEIEVVEYFRAKLSPGTTSKAIQNRKDALEKQEVIDGWAFSPLLSLLILDVSGKFLWSFNSADGLANALKHKFGFPYAQALSIADDVENAKSK